MPTQKPARKWQPGLFATSCGKITGRIYSSNKPLSFTSLSHSDNQSEPTTKFYNSSKADVGVNVLTHFVRTEI